MTNQSVNVEVPANQIIWDEERCGYCPGLFQKNMGTAQCGGACLLIIGFMLIMVLVPLTFSYVEYDEYALKKDTIDNTVDITNTYDHGTYAWGVNKEPLTFPRQFQEFSRAFPIFPENGLEFDIHVTFFWKVQKDNLGILYKAFGQTFDDQVENRANAVIKNIAPTFSLERYISERYRIAQALHEGLEVALNSIYIDVPFDKFYLRDIDIPASVRERDLSAAVQIQRNAEEQNHQLATLVRKETDKLVEEVSAEINLIGLTAAAQAVALEKEASAEAERITASIDGLGLEDLFEEINVTDSNTKEKYIAYFAFLDAVQDSEE